MKDAAKEANVRLLRLHHAIWEGLDDPLGWQRPSTMIIDCETGTDGGQKG